MRRRAWSDGGSGGGGRVGVGVVRSAPSFWSRQGRGGRPCCGVEHARMICMRLQRSRRRRGMPTPRSRRVVAPATFRVGSPSHSRRRRPARAASIRLSLNSCSSPLRGPRLTALFLLALLFQGRGTAMSKATSARSAPGPRSRAPTKPARPSCQRPPSRCRRGTGRRGNRGERWRLLLRNPGPEPCAAVGTSVSGEPGLGGLVVAAVKRGRREPRPEPELERRSVGAAAAAASSSSPDSSERCVGFPGFRWQESRSIVGERLQLRPRGLVVRLSGS